MSAGATGTGIERTLRGLLRHLNLIVVDERPFDPYRVDLYCPELHVAFEADGPTHGFSGRDRKRDGELAEKYGLVVYRVPLARLRNEKRRVEVLAEIEQCIPLWTGTYLKRVKHADRHAPEWRGM